MKITCIPGRFGTAGTLNCASCGNTCAFFNASNATRCSASFTLGVATCDFIVCELNVTVPI